MASVGSKQHSAWAYFCVNYENQQHVDFYKKFWDCFFAVDDMKLQ